MPLAAARAAAPVVSSGTLARPAADRMWSPSARGPRPLGEFTTSFTSPALIRSTALTPSTSPSLATSTATSTPASRTDAAVPLVAQMVKPISASSLAASTPDALSRSASERNTMPSSGKRVPAASWDFTKARPGVRSMPMTSPVLRISGPRTASASGNRLNGSTASLIATWSPSTRSHIRPSARSSARVAPTMIRLATLASGTPVALATNGTVRLARGLASITKTWLPFTAYCTLIRPLTSSASAIRNV